MGRTDLLHTTPTHPPTPPTHTHTHHTHIQVHIGHEQQVAYCQEIGQRLQADLNIQLSSLQHHHQQVTKELTKVHSTGTFLTTIAEEDTINGSPQRITTTQPSRGTEESLQTVEQSQKLLAQSKLLLDRTEDLETSRDVNKQVLEQLQSNLKQSEQLLDDSKLVQSHLEQSQQMRTRTNLDQSSQVLEQVQTKLTQSKDVLDQVQSTLNQSKQVLDQLKSQLDETKQASSQVQLNLNHSKAVLQQLQSNVDQDETTSNLNRDNSEQKETNTQSDSMEAPESENDHLSHSEPDEIGIKTLELETEPTDHEAKEAPDGLVSSTGGSGRGDEATNDQSLSELEKSSTPEATPPDDDDDIPPSSLSRTHLWLSSTKPTLSTPTPSHTPPTQLTPSQTPPTSDQLIDDTHETRTIYSDQAEDNGDNITQAKSNSETSSTSDDNLVFTEQEIARGNI